MPRAPGGGSLADDFAKGIAEVGLIGKPAFQCDLAERIVRYGHQLLRARDSHSFDVLAGCAAKTCFEDAIELVAVELGDPGQIPGSDLRMKVNGYITLDAARLP